MTKSTSPYIGRFAPTPTGPLHFGSLVSALASYLDAKYHKGTWLLRIEDLDPPREDPTASQRILEQLQQHALHWDGDVQFQSQHHNRYEWALATLEQHQHTFPCQCTRKQLTEHNGLHLGQCSSGTQGSAIRLKVPDKRGSINDRIYGHFSQNLYSEVGDQVLKRKDGLYAYQLAVVVDDHAAGINHVVRGVDLLDNTPRQVYLMECLEFETPSYMHIPLVTNTQGQKLSKQNLATAIEGHDAKQNVLQALQFLNQPITDDMRQSDLPQLLALAVSNWRPSLIKPSQAGII